MQTDLEEMRKILGPNGEAWIKGNFHTPEGHCLVGAASWAYGYKCNDYLGVMRDVIHEQYPEFGDAGAVGLFNDDDDTTWADVERVLDKTEVRLGEIVTD